MNQGEVGLGSESPCEFSARTSSVYEVDGFKPVSTSWSAFKRRATMRHDGADAVRAAPAHVHAEPSLSASSSWLNLHSITIRGEKKQERKVHSSHSRAGESKINVLPARIKLGLSQPRYDLDQRAIGNVHFDGVAEQR